MAKNNKLIRGSWSENEIELLRELFPTMETREIACQLERPLTAVRQKAYEMGLKTKGYSCCWSDGEVNMLEELFPVKKTQEVADLLGRSFLAVQVKAFRMNTRKTKDYLRAIGRA